MESDLQTRGALETRLRGRGGFMTCELSLLECRCRPLRLDDQKLLALYDALFSSSDMQLCPVDRRVIERATELRAGTKLRTPDAIHLASALVNGATQVWTGDVYFTGISLMPVELV